MRRILPLAGLAIMATGCIASQQATKPAVLWIVAELAHPSANAAKGRVDVDGQPRVTQSATGPFVSFDGAADRIVVGQNPLAGADEFTIEVVLRPHDVFPASREPRFLHIESPSNPERRLTMELRLTENHQWYLDAFIKSDEDKMTLADATKLHPTGRWYHAAVTYKDGSFTTFIDGTQELQARVHYAPIPADARTSIGARLNRVHWFAGDIASVRVTPAAIPPSHFKDVPARRAH